MDRFGYAKAQGREFDFRLRRRPSIGKQNAPNVRVLRFRRTLNNARWSEISTELPTVYGAPHDHFVVLTPEFFKDTNSHQRFPV